MSVELTAPQEVLDAVKVELKKLEDDPNITRIVEVVDSSLVNDSCSCSSFGWMFSAKRLPRSPAKSAVALNKESN